MKRFHAIVAATLLVASGALYATCQGRPAPAPAPRPPSNSSSNVGAAFGARVAWVVAITRAQEGVLLALQRLIDNVIGGYPAQSFVHAPGFAMDGRLAPHSYDATHHTAVRYHPHILHRCAMPLDPAARLIVLAAINRCTDVLDAGALPDGGAVPAWCTPLTNLTMVASLPSDWDDVLGDAGPAYWFDPDSGLNDDPPQTPDDLDGGVP